MNGILNNFTKKTNLQFQGTINVEENTEQIFFVDNPVVYTCLCRIETHSNLFFFPNNFSTQVLQFNDSDKIIWIFTGICMNWKSVGRWNLKPSRTWSLTWCTREGSKKSIIQKKYLIWKKIINYCFPDFLSKRIFLGLDLSLLSPLLQDLILLHSILTSATWIS